MSDPSSAAKVTAVIPHWNRRDLLDQLLTNLTRQIRPFDQVIVVDNGSTDGSAELAEQRGAQVVRLPQNLGFAVAVNRGIAAAAVNSGTPEENHFVAILNNDVILEPGWLANLLIAIRLPEAPGKQYTFATGKIRSAKDSTLIDGTWDEISRAACSLRCGSGQPDGPLWNTRRTIRMASMTAVLIRAGLFTKIGTLDEHFGSYLEDVDFGLRCAIASCPGVYEPRAVCSHLGSATLGRWNPDSVRWIARNQVLLTEKHFSGLPGRFSVAIRLLWGQGLWGLVALKHGCGFAWLRGKIAGWAGAKSVRPGPQTRDQAAAFAEIVRSSEQQIFEIQKQTCFDLYWRMYFKFAGGDQAVGNQEGSDR